jgi:hypothetical protein
MNGAGNAENSDTDADVITERSNSLLEGVNDVLP